MVHQAKPGRRQPREPLGRQPFIDVINGDGRSIAWVARQIGINYTHFVTVSDGRTAPSPELKERLSAFLGVPEEELFTAAALTTEYWRTRHSRVVSEPGE